ncbi:hypothetical protein FA15DRAFT_664310 [Coprinopsis marcescibilis]|uniref:Protein EFR3 n=1 Tax=Coprinopsis marcescibilis TaxID=230819 RepID=A0A5C3LBK5_COPMA|nr:hypothetical protein FA15DRAFT_664310 [Coprinopsis marcescibilis]
MRFLFTPNHVQLLNSCYPPTSALLTAGPDYSPSAHELSRLTYHASNHPGKLAKLGPEIEKRVQAESKKAKSGNLRARSSLLISLAILRALATECRRDIALVSPFLISSLHVTLGAAPQDLEVVARVASVFTAWTTYTNGNLIGADQTLTENYLSVLQHFADLSSSDTNDQEIRNRTRLIGFAAITGALNSEALYNDSRQFKAQVLILMKPILKSLFETDIKTLEDQSSVTRDSPGSPYLAEFRIRPALERRAASIHLHVDGDKGPTSNDVADAGLRALFSLLNHAGGAQLGNIMQSTFENLSKINGWEDIDHCRWYIRKAVEWAQYQYRFVAPTWLVEKLLEQQDAPTVSPRQIALASMVASVFTSSTPLINLSSADLMSNLLTLLLRRTSIYSSDPLIPHVIKCIGSLGCHVYYSDQIQDLAGELINRITMIEVQGLSGNSVQNGRSYAICHLMAALMGLLKVTDEYEAVATSGATKAQGGADTDDPVPVIEIQKPDKLPEVAPRRTRISPETWQDSLSLICDPDPQVRSEYSGLLVYYLKEEMPKLGDSLEWDGVRRVKKLADGSMLQAANVNLFLHSGDSGSRFLNSLHAYAYILATNPIPSSTTAQDPHADSANPGSSTKGQPIVSSGPGPRRSESLSHRPKARKISQMRRLTQHKPVLQPPVTGWTADYKNLLDVLKVVHEELPIRGLLTGVPFLLQLDAHVASVEVIDGEAIQLRNFIAEVWKVIGNNWHCTELVDLCSKVVGSDAEFIRRGELNSTCAPRLLSESIAVQDALGMGKHDICQRFARKWTPQLALQNFPDERANRFDASVRGDNISPLLKISPALMQIENMSLQSLARSTRGLGVSDLREALEGRNGMSNPALGRPASISTFDYPSSMTTGHGGLGEGVLRLTPTRSRTKASSGPRRGSNNGDVREVLSKLGIGKQGANLLKAPFSSFQKTDN